jgi:hypothetical protein
MSGVFLQTDDPCSRGLAPAGADHLHSNRRGVRAALECVDCAVKGTLDYIRKGKMVGSEGKESLALTADGASNNKTHLLRQFILARLK